jgi:hypothetical protein
MGRRSAPPSDEFTNEEVCAFERELEQLHPDNPDKQHRGRSATFVVALALCANPSGHLSSPGYDAASRPDTTPARHPPSFHSRRRRGQPR